MARATLIAPFARYAGRVQPPTSGQTTGAVVAMPSSDGRTFVRRDFTPDQPDSPYQVEARANMALVSEAFQSLVIGDVGGWRTLADTMTRFDSLGQRYTPSWAAVFNMVNNYRVAAGQPIITTAPVPPTRARLTVQSLASDDNTPDQEVIVTAGDGQPTAPGFVRVRISRPSASPIFQIPDEFLRYVTADTNESFFTLGSLGSPAWLTLQATRMNIMSGFYYAVELVTLSADYVPVGPPFVTRLIQCTPS